MIWKAISLLTLAVCVLGDGHHHHAYSEQRVELRNVQRGHHGELGHIGHEPEHHQEYAHAYPSYEFSYLVSDPHTHDFKGQHESREGDVVRGVYWLVQPDGVKRTVKYHADKHSGFKAQVQYEGHHEHRVENHPLEDEQNEPAVEQGNPEAGDREADEQNQGRENENLERENSELENSERENRGRENRESEIREREDRGRENRESENRERENRGRENRQSENRERENRGRENRQSENRERENRGRENRGRENRGRENRGRENQGRENRERENENRERENENREPEAARHMPKKQNEHKILTHKQIIEHIVPVFGEREQERDVENHEPIEHHKPIPVFDFERIQPKVEHKEHKVELKKKPFGYHQEVHHHWIEKKEHIENKPLYKPIRMQEERPVRSEEAEPERRQEEENVEERDGHYNYKRHEPYYGLKSRHYKH